MKRKQRYPRGWDEARVQRVLRHYESQSEGEAVDEAEGAFRKPGSTVMVVPTEAVPAIREFLAKRRNRRTNRKRKS